MKLTTEPYLDQAARWPKTGRHILAQFDEKGIIVYQAYRPSIGLFAAQNGCFGGEFSLQRMSWIKPSFLWMMFRSGWGSKTDQEIVLAITLQRDAFELILEQAVCSTLLPSVYGSEDKWKHALETSDVRFQWDPDHHPSGANLERRAIQLGLRGQALARYAREWILDIEDISDFVREQAKHAASKSYSILTTPSESLYSVSSPALAAKLGLSQA